MKRKTSDNTNGSSLYTATSNIEIDPFNMKDSTNPSKKPRRDSPKNDDVIHISPPNMNKVMSDMREFETNNIINGFSIDKTDLHILGGISSGNQNPSSVFRELFNDMLGETRPHVLNSLECYQCQRIYHNYASIKISTREFKGKLFETPFDVKVLSKYSKDVIGNVRTAIKEKLIESYWMPFLNDHYDWIKIFGICPFYFEPVILTQNSKPAVFYVPVCPKPEMGTISVYQRKNRSQGYLWKWSSDSLSVGADKDLPLNGGGMGIPPPQSFGQSSGMSIASSNTNSAKIFTAGPVSMAFETGNSSNASRSISSRAFSGSRSRYMFFNVKRPPMLNGYLTSEIKSIMVEIINLEKMEALEISAAQKQLNPPCIVEFSPDPVKMTQGDNSDNNRLKLETDLKLLFHRESSYLRDDSETNALRSDIQNNDIMSTGLGPGQERNPKNMSAMHKVMKYHNELQAPMNYPEIPLGLYDPSNYEDYKLLQLNNAGANTNNNSTELERLLLYVKNNPGSNITETINKMGKTQLNEPPNATYLRPYHKLASGSPKISMPNFDLGDTKIRVDKLAASVVDFPLELLMNRTGNRDSQEVALQFLKDRLNSESKYYETIVRHMWWMASSPIITSTKEIMSKLLEQKTATKKTKKDSMEKQKNTSVDEPEKTPDIAKKYKNIIYTMTPDDIDQWNNIEIAFPKIPFLDLETVLNLYEFGVLDETRLMSYLTTIYNVPDDGDVSRVTKKMTEFLKRKYGESTIELQGKINATQEKLKEKSMEQKPAAGASSSKL
jgi:hypothetical protein